MGDDLRPAVLKRLKHSVQLLASPAEVQLRLLPPYACRADELALEFDHWREVVVRNYRDDFTADQISVLATLDETFDRLTACGKEHWTDEAIRTSSEWENIRHLATQILEAFGWPIETPSSHAAEYVSPAQFLGHNQN